MAGANLNEIYQRLHSAEKYHPISAETFADWSMEAGDVVTVTREGKEYASPVHSSTLKWYGKQQMSINSGGEEKREAITRTSQKKYGRGGSAVRTAEIINRDIYSEDGHLHSSLKMTESTFRVFVEDKYKQMSSGIALTSSSMALFVEDRYKQLTSGIKLTSSSLALFVEDRYKQMTSGIKLTSSSLALFVEDRYKQMTSGIQLTTSSLAFFVEDRYKQMTSGMQLTASSLKLFAETVEISGDRVKIDGETSINQIFSITNKEVYALKTIYALAPDAWFNGKHVGTFYYSENQQGHSVEQPMLKKAQVDGNTLKIWTFADADTSPSITFNKAVSLSGAWSSGVYTISATSGTISSQPDRDTRTLFDLGLGTPEKAAGNTVNITYDIGYAATVQGERRRGGSTGKTGKVNIGLGSLLQSKTVTANATVTPDTGYLGLTSVVVNVPGGTPSWGTSGFANDTSNLPSGTRHEVDSLKTAIVNNRTNRGYVYFTITVSGTRHVYYFADNGNGWTS